MHSGLKKIAMYPLHRQTRDLPDFDGLHSFNPSSRDPAITVINLNADSFPVALRSCDKGRTAAHERIKYCITDKRKKFNAQAAAILTAMVPDGLFSLSLAIKCPESVYPLHEFLTGNIGFF